MASAFLGKWTVDLSQTTGLDEYGPALGLSAQQIEAYRKMVYSVELSQTGDGYKTTLSFESDAIPSQTFTYDLGKPFPFHALDGTLPMLTVTVVGGKFVEDYKLGEEKEWQVVREVNGTVMTSTTTFAGKSLVQKLNKQ